MGSNLAHAPIPASGAPVWGHCSGSIIASQGADDTWSAASDAGTAAHWVGSTTLEKWQASKRATVPDCAAMLGQVAPNGVVIDEAMIEGAQVYVDDVTAVVLAQGGGDLFIEHAVIMPKIHEKNAGTLDAALVRMWATDHDRRFMTIDIWDYKHGHRAVSAEGNLQLVDYLTGLMQQYGLNGSHDQFVQFTARIVQPFAYSGAGPVSSWTGVMSDLRAHVNKMHEKAEEAYAGPRLSPGKWCRDCPAVMRCDAAKKYVYAWTDYANSPYVIDSMPLAAMVTEREILADAMGVMKSRLNALDDVLTHRISDGAAGTGLALQATSGNNAWTVPVAQAVAIAQQFGADIAKAGALTPTQATQRVPKDLRLQFGEVLKSISARPAGKMKLIRAEDSIAAKAFAKPKEA